MTTMKTRMVGAVIVGVAAVFIAAKCGDVSTFQVSPSEWSPTADRGYLQDLNGATMELERVSSRCDEDVSQKLLAKVSSEMEFPAESVVTLKSPCAGGSEIALQVDIEARSIVYDFCNVAAAAVFPDAEFEGFVVTDVFHSVAPIRGASIDWTESTMAMKDDAISFDEHSVRINLAGLDYDETCRVKIDLILATDREAAELDES